MITKNKEIVKTFGNVFVKIIENINQIDFQNEVSIQNKCAEQNIAPDIEFSGKLADGKYIIVMKKMQMSLYDYVVKHKKKINTKEFLLLQKQINKMHRIGVYHADLHLGNIMLNLNPKSKEIKEIKIIDFGRSIMLPKSIKKNTNIPKNFRNKYFLSNNQQNTYEILANLHQLPGMRNNWKNLKIIYDKYTSKPMITPIKRTLN